MNVRTLDEKCSVSPQLQPGDLASLAASGFNTLMCNRPDGEDPDQPSASCMADAARACGMAFVHLPVAGGVFSEADVQAFADATRTGQGRALAYCRSGTRSACLWALSQSASRNPDELLALAAAAGYDLSALRSRMQAATRRP